MSPSTSDTPVIEIKDLHRKYGSREAVNGLSLTVQPGRCYGLFGRNGAGKTTTIKCLLNLLRPTSGTVRLFGDDPARDNVRTKARFCYVPDTVGFYPWMSVHKWFEYMASFRQRWNVDLQNQLMEQFELDPTQRAVSMSKGQQAQIALITALCPEPELLILDEPTSGLDPLVRREFIRTVIGAYQDAEPGKRTVFVSTHMITEFEGLIDEFTVIDQGKEILTMESENARERYTRIRASFPDEQPETTGFPCVSLEAVGRDIEFIANGSTETLLASIHERQGQIQEQAPLSLEEIFIASLKDKVTP